MSIRNIFLIARRRLQPLVKSLEFVVILITLCFWAYFKIPQVSDVSPVNLTTGYQKTLTIKENGNLIKENGIMNASTFVAKSLRHIKYGLAHECEPKFNIMYLKTHKCASSTMQNIIFRYACTHDQKHNNIPCGQNFNTAEEEGLKKKDDRIQTNDDRVRGSNPLRAKMEENSIFVAVPSYGIYAGHPRRFEASMLQHPEWLLPPSGRANIFGLHTRMDSYELQKVVPEDALWITVLRDPASLYVSAFNYFKMNVAVGSSLQDFLRRPLDQMKHAKRMADKFGANQMTFDLGYDPHVFYDDLEIDEMIRDVEETFDLVLIAERLEESLVMLGHALCWSIDDLVSLDKNVRSERHELTPIEKSKVEKLNYSDLRLYRHFYRQFDALVRSYGKEKLQEEVEALRAKKKVVQEYCVKGIVEGHHPNASIKEYSGAVLGYDLLRPDDPLCRALAWNSKHYISYFRDLMKDTFQGRQ